MSTITLEQRLQYMACILNDQDFLDYVLESASFEERIRYRTTVLQPIGEQLKDHDAATHTPEENLAILDTVNQLYETLRVQNGFKTELVQPFDELFWPQDWRPDDSILEKYHRRNRYQKRMALTSLPRNLATVFVHAPFHRSLGWLIQDQLQADILTFQGVLFHQRFSGAVNYVNQYPTAAYSEQGLKTGTIVKRVHVEQMMKHYSVLTQFVKDHFFQDGFVDEYTLDCAELAKLCNPTAYLLVAKTLDDHWCMILDEQASALAKFIFKKILDPVYFNRTFLDGPPDRAIAFLSQLQKENTHNFYRFENSGRVEGYYSNEQSELLNTFISEFTDKITTPAFIKKLPKSPEHPEYQTIKTLLKLAEVKKQVATLRMTTMVLLQGQRQSDHVLKRTPKDMIRKIAGLTAGDKLDDQAQKQSIAEAEAFNARLKLSQQATDDKLTKEIEKLIQGFKAYRARIDRFESKSDGDAKFRHFLFPFGKESRAKNRKINYQISEKITTDLESLIKSKRDLKREDLDSIFKPFRRKGLYFAYTTSNHSKPHIIRSHQLNTQIKQVLATVGAKSR